MCGEVIGVWAETWREIWLSLTDRPLVEYAESLPGDIFCELYRVLAPALSSCPWVEDLGDIIDNVVQSREPVESTSVRELLDDRALVGFVESVHEALEEFGGDTLTNHYFTLLSGFIDKFILRYDLRRPCVLCPTLPGVFASLVRDLRAPTAQDPHLDGVMEDFEAAARNLRHDSSERRIKTCIQKQVSLLEATGRSFPGVTVTTLGTICNQVGTWPLEKLKEAMTNVYGFANDYPDIRHGGTPASALRAVDMRDIVAMSTPLTGFTPYFVNRLRADPIFGANFTPTRPVSSALVIVLGPGTLLSKVGRPRGLLSRPAFWRQAN